MAAHHNHSCTVLGSGASDANIYIIYVYTLTISRISFSLEPFFPFFFLPFSSGCSFVLFVSLQDEFILPGDIVCYVIQVAK